MLKLENFDKAADLVREVRALDKAIFDATPNQYRDPRWAFATIQGVAIAFPVGDLVPVLERQRDALLDELRALGVEW